MIVRGGETLAGRIRAGLGIAVVLIAGLAGTSPRVALAQATGPAFDCAKAAGTVEKLICGDAGLAALDRRLDAVYKAALVKAKDDMPRLLRAEQRGWVTGRNECWKAKGPNDPIYLTESWIATGAQACVEGEYQQRITELQVKYQLVASKPPVFFACNNNPADEVVAAFFDTDPPAARFERGDRTVIGWQVRSGSGAKYEGQNFVFWNKGNEATVTWRGEELACKVK